MRFFKPSGNTSSGFLKTALNPAYGGRFSFQKSIVPPLFYKLILWLVLRVFINVNYHIDISKKKRCGDVGEEFCKTRLEIEGTFRTLTSQAQSAFQQVGPLTQHSLSAGAHCQPFPHHCPLSARLTFTAREHLFCFFGGLLHKQGPRGARLRGAPLPHSHNALVATSCSVCPPAGGPSGGPGVPPQHRGPTSVQ